MRDTLIVLGEVFVARIQSLNDNYKVTPGTYYDIEPKVFPSYIDAVDWARNLLPVACQPHISFRS